EQLLLKGCFQQSVTRPFHHQYKTAALAAYLNQRMHTERRWLVFTSGCRVAAAR
ncbi:hypothetical protein FHS27_006130, partial [Rhodopirellula rubra]|nr:hypothetical protein [Aporhodopirellula rubra]